MKEFKKVLAKLFLGSSDMVDHFIDLSTAHKDIAKSKQKLAALLQEQNLHQQNLTLHSNAFSVAKTKLTAAFNGE